MQRIKRRTKSFTTVPNAKPLTRTTIAQQTFPRLLDYLRFALVTVAKKCLRSSLAKVMQLSVAIPAAVKSGGPVIHPDTLQRMDSTTTMRDWRWNHYPGCLILRPIQKHRLFLIFLTIRVGSVL